jgi:hypothetical protein
VSSIVDFGLQIADYEAWNYLLRIEV